MKKILIAGIPIFSKKEADTSVILRKFWIYISVGIIAILLIYRIDALLWLIILSPLLLILGVLFYLFLIPNLIEKKYNKNLKNLKIEFTNILTKLGNIDYLDCDVLLQEPSGFAVVNSEFYFIKDFFVFLLPHDRIVGLQWEVNSGTRMIPNTGIGIDIQSIAFNSNETRSVTKTNGIYIKTNDPNFPKAHFRTNNVSICEKWEVIFNNYINAR